MLALALTALSAPALAAPLFVGDYQTRDDSQWPGHEFPAGGFEVVAPPRRAAPAPKPYRWVAKFTIGLGGPAFRRSEVLRRPIASDGQEGLTDYWRWYLMFPPSFHGPPQRGTDLILSDWHPIGAACVPTEIFGSRGRNLYLRVRAGRTKLQRWTGHFPPVDRGYEGRAFHGAFEACETQTDRRYTLIRKIRPYHWYQITTAVHWSSNARRGYMRVWVDGCRRTPPYTGRHRARSYFATLLAPHAPTFPEWGVPPASNAAFFKQGIYDSWGWPLGTRPDTVYYTGTTQYSRLRDVWPRRPRCRS